MIKSLLPLISEALTLKNLTLKDCSLPLSLVSKDLLITTSLTPALTHYITSFIIYATIIIIKTLRLKSIAIKEKVTNTTIIIKRFKRKKVRVI